ncbi:N(6)-adenine-specific DNA methyltransferase METTL4 [Lamellibrachia satsuma]|nr:N(6)-adenine-specific DNA methyltransferase METTL4 [Lamellibrachia satsuma]
MDSQFDKLKKNTRIESQPEETASVSDTGSARRKKRKRKLPLNEGELAALGFHKKVNPILDKALSHLVGLGKEKGYFMERSNDGRGTDNNLAARQAACLTDTFLVDIVELARQTDTEHSATIILTDESTEQEEILVNHMIKHKSDKATLRRWMGRCYLLPPHCSFLLSDLHHLSPLLRDAQQYNLIVIDPPWQNKSVKRKKKYWTLDNGDLQRLPVKELSADGCLVVMWVTNRQSIHQYITQKLFPWWGVKFDTCWYWLKLTTQGIPVCDLDLAMKKPYETLILGHVSHTEASSMEVDLPDARVIASVPSSVHSQKPPLHDILKAYLPDDARCLELFARNLQPGWTSWGNEVLKHQELKYFEEVHTEETSTS